MIKKILVAVDGSENANRALDQALDLAEKYHAKIELVSVVHEVKITLPSYPSPVIADYLEEMRNIHLKILSDTLKRARSAKPKVEITEKLLKGRPVDEIVKFAEDGKFDLIVMGSRGLSSFKRLFLGSVSNGVVNNSAISVLIVK